MGIPPRVPSMRPTGASEMCKFNEHAMCNGIAGSHKCSCDCHIPKAEPVVNVPAQIEDQRELKLCPKCQVKRPSGERFCRQCGLELGSLQCMGCGKVANQEDKYCWSCGFPMNKKEAQKWNAREPFPLTPHPASMPQVAMGDPTPAEIAQEQAILRQLQNLQPPVEPTRETQTFSLPQGTFRVSTENVKAGKVHQHK